MKTKTKEDLSERDRESLEAVRKGSDQDINAAERRPKREKKKEKQNKSENPSPQTSREGDPSARGPVSKLKKLRRILDDPDFNYTVKKVYQKAVSILKHIFPRRGNISLSFGMDDPSVTGRVLAALSLFFPVFHGNLQITPYFDRVILEGEAGISGRIRLGTIAVNILPLILNKKVRTQIKAILHS